ncbi:MAG: SWIM zinc finger family protein [Chloroflexota bacterium]
MARSEVAGPASVYVARALALTDPGPAAAGVFIRDARGRLVSHRSYYLGYATAQEAGLRAVLAALRLCQTLGLSAPRLVVDERWLADLAKGHGELPAALAAYGEAWQEALAAVPDLRVEVTRAAANPARAVALAPLVEWLPERTRRAENLTVRDLGDGEYEVASERQPELVYRVHLPPTERIAAGEQIRCECPDFQHRGIPCKHLLVVAQATGGRERLFYPEAAGGPSAPRGPSEAGPEEER